MDKTVELTEDRPSTWFQGHELIISPGMQVLDIACGHGRHSLAAAKRGAQVTAIDSDEKKLAGAKRRAEQQNLQVNFVAGDLKNVEIPGMFDAVLMFNYLDRDRFSDFVGAVKPAGWLLCETFLESQTVFGWGPTNPAHLLEPGELFKLIHPLGLVFGREVTEVIDNRNAARASVLARRAQ